MKPEELTEYRQVNTIRAAVISDVIEGAGDDVHVIINQPRYHRFLLSACEWNRDLPSAGDYFVIETDGRFTWRTAKDFNANYFELVRVKASD